MIQEKLNNRSHSNGLLTHMGEEAFLGEEGGEWEPLSYLGI
jgi:hypothetical protein